MKHEELEDKQWKRIRRVFSRIPQPAHSEHFVRSVMFRVRALEKAEPFSVLSRWLFPAFAVAAACLMLSVMVPAADAVSTDSLLFSQTGGASLSQGSSSVPAEDPLALLER